MKTEKWRTKEGAGFFHESVQNAEAVKLTVSNADEVASWCGGTVQGLHNVMVPSRKFVGDPNKRTKTEDGKADLRDLREVSVVIPAAPGKYVVKWNDRFYVPDVVWFEAAYEKEN